MEKLVSTIGETLFVFLPLFCSPLLQFCDAEKMNFKSGKAMTEFFLRRATP